ncbi:MAG: GTPase of the mitochondrial inner membrane that associates with the large ribosomal subunit [Stictis urceolatum]|nr:GTPase of the mitochondrial inner membrane that associates with the large ribosomal subunit [Stictis urceolata]
MPKFDDDSDTVRSSSTLTADEHPTTPDLSPPLSHLNPSPEDYARSIFADKCRLILQAGSGGHGRVSFLREKWIAEGPPNGGDGGSGGNVYIQAVKGETSLHKLANQRLFKATRGRNGQGKSKGGQRGEDVLIQVPVGTVVREVGRIDPVALEETAKELESNEFESTGPDEDIHRRRSQWVVAPSAEPSELANMHFPRVPRNRRTHLAAALPHGPISLDLSKPMKDPMLLAAGAAGGLGNPHFATESRPRPLFATRGSHGMRLELELELKLLADLGFVGLPNAGKSTLLRALTRSRARVGNWAFTTLQPNIGTVVLDDHRGRAKIEAFDAEGERKTQFSIADIPGLVPGAHLDYGLGLDFLRHIERAQVLAFVLDLSNGDAVEILQTLWKELEEFEKIKEEEVNQYSETRIVTWQAFGSSMDESVIAGDIGEEDGTSKPLQKSLPPIEMPPISSKPWFVVASKADLEGTQDNFLRLKNYLADVESGSMEHPNNRRNKWTGPLKAIPISAIRGEGVDQIAKTTISLLSG